MLLDQFTLGVLVTLYVFTLTGFRAFGQIYTVFLELLDGFTLAAFSVFD